MTKTRPPRVFKDKKGYFLKSGKKKIYLNINTKKNKKKNKKNDDKKAIKIVINNFTTKPKRRRRKSTVSKKDTSKPNATPTKLPPATAIISNQPITKTYQPLSSNPEFYQSTQERANIIVKDMLEKRSEKAIKDMSNRESKSASPDMNKIVTNQNNFDNLDWNKAYDIDSISMAGDTLPPPSAEEIAAMAKSVEGDEDKKEVEVDSDDDDDDDDDDDEQTKLYKFLIELGSGRTIKILIQQAGLFGISIPKNIKKREDVALYISQNIHKKYKNVEKYKAQVVKRYAKLTAEYEKKSGLKGSGLVAGGNDSGLYSDEIQQILKKHTGVYIPVIPSDKVKDIILDNKKDTYFVMNLDASNKPGSHWVAVYISPTKDKSIEYYDSLALGKFPKDFMKQIKTIVSKLNLPYYLKFKQNMIRHQSYKTTTCGFFSIKFIIDRINGVQFKECTDFINKEGEIRKFRSKWGYL